MKILILRETINKKMKYISDAVILAALEKHLCQAPTDLTDYLIDPSQISSEQYVKKMAAVIQEEQTDVILCTGLNGMGLMSAVRKLTGLSVWTCGIVSDYFCSPLLYKIELDCFFVPHEEIKAKLICKGIPSDRIFVTGIPVKKCFREHIGKAAARNYLVIPRNRHIYLLIPDGLAYETIIRLCEELSEAEQEDFALYIPTPRCSTIRDQLIDYAERNSHIRIITYTTKLNLYLESADAMLLKPEPIFSTEAAVAGVPIVHLSLNAAEKNYSSGFFSRHEMAVSGNSIRDTIQKAKRFVEEKAMAARMIQMQYRNIYSDAADKIIDIIIKKIDMNKRKPQSL